MSSKELDFNAARVLYGEHPPAAIDSLQVTLDGLKTLTTLADFDEITNTNTHEIEKQLALDVMRSDFSDRLLSAYIKRELNEYKYTGSYPREFSSSISWLMHFKTTQFVTPTTDNFNNYCVPVTHKKQTKLEWSPTNLPIAVWILGSAYNFEKEVWEHYGVVNADSLKPHKEGARGLEFLNERDYSFSGDKFCYLRFSHSEQIPQQNEALPTSDEVHEAYEPKTKKLIFNNLRLPFETPVVSDLRIPNYLTKNTFQRFNIMEGFTALIAARNTQADGSIDWSNFDANWQAVIQLKQFLDKIEPETMESSAAYDLFVAQEYRRASYHSETKAQKSKREAMQSSSTYLLLQQLIQLLGRSDSKKLYESLRAFRS